MARDRLAALKAQRTQNHEMSDLQVPPSVITAPVGQSSFLSEVASIQDDIKEYNENINRISVLRARSLNAIDQGAEEETTQLDALSMRMREMSQNLKQRIQRLENSPGQQDAEMRKNRIAFVRSKFVEAIQHYQQVEQEFRAKSRQRVERQFKIVKPDATPEEVEAISHGEGQQIFAQALTSTTRYAESRVVYREVQERQQDIQKMEHTLAELAQLFSDMATLVEQQDPVIAGVEAAAKDVEDNTEQGLKHTGQAVIHAKSYRKGRWICFFIFLIIIAVVAIVVGVVVGGHK